VIKIKRYLGTYISILFTFLCVDGIWLGFVAGDSYREAVGHVMRNDFPIWPWVVFYLVYVGAILYLAVSVSSTKKHSAIRGAILGMAAYGAYNLTNYSIIIDWPLAITLQDWLWGTALTAVSAFAGGAVWQWLGSK
jgi:uncharacterized membrane protein